ncbi:MAG: ATP-binding protein [Thermodesulfobacteriota bacterium]
MMNFYELWKHFKLLSPPETFSQEERTFLEKFLQEEYKLREKKRIEYLMKTSGIKRIKYLHDFDWTFNPKIPRDKIMEFINTDWLRKPSNLVIIGPAGTGKTHIATALCHDALSKGHQTIFITLFDLVAKLSRANNPFSLIEYYAKVPILCIDELGYAVPTKEQADWIFQIISKRTELATTIITTNLIPSNWGKIFDSVTASAILDRLSLNGRFITFEGRSYRSKNK